MQTTQLTRSISKGMNISVYAWELVCVRIYSCLLQRSMELIVFVWMAASKFIHEYKQHSSSSSFLRGSYSWKYWKPSCSSLHSPARVSSTDWGLKMDAAAVTSPTVSSIDALEPWALNFGGHFLSFWSQKWWYLDERLKLENSYQSWTVCACGCFISASLASSPWFLSNWWWRWLFAWKLREHVAIAR